MISGYGSGSKVSENIHHRHVSGGFPVPFNIPVVLHNLLYSDLDLDLDAKQQDIFTTLRFSHEALQKMLQNSAQKEYEYKSRLMHEPDNRELAEELKDLELEKMDAVGDFKELLVVMSEMLTKEQYEKLLKASNLPV